MQPGSIEFRKHLSKLIPQNGGEAKANYIARAARHFGISPSRMTVLYYDQRKDNARFTPDEYQRIFLRTHQAVTTAKHPELNELKSKLEEQDRNISRLEKIVAQNQQFKRKLGELLISH